MRLFSPELEVLETPADLAGNIFALHPTKYAELMKQVRLLR